MTQVASLVEGLLQRAREAGVSLPPSPTRAVDVIRAVKAIPYGRATDRRPATLVAEWRGTCSGKHYLLQAALAELGLQMELVHRVYRLSQEEAALLFPQAAAWVPALEGLTDVHTYARVPLHGRRVRVDVTFPGDWDGASDLPLACGLGTDFVIATGGDAQAVKELLVREFCLPAVREPFIAALGTVAPLPSDRGAREETVLEPAPPVGSVAVAGWRPPPPSPSP